MLGLDTGDIRCPLMMRLGFQLKSGDNPISFLEDLLEERGLGSPEELRRSIPVPGRRLICRPNMGEAPSSLAAPEEEVLRQALLLGLCTANLYDPGRPVIWTRASLSRVIDLFSPEGFYS